MLKRIPQYEAEGILDSANASRLSEHLENKLKVSESYFVSAIYFAGAMLLLASACLFITNVWEDLSIPQRLAVAFLPLVMSGIFGIIVILKDWGKFIRESASVCNIFSFGFMLIVVANTLGLPPNAEAFLMTMITFGFFVMYIFKSEIVAGGIAILTSILISYFSRNIPSTFEVLFVVVSMALVCLFTAKDWKDAPTLRRVLGLVVCICVLTAGVGFVRMFMNYGCVDFVPDWYDSYFCQIVASGFASILLLSASYGRFANLTFYRLPHLYVGLVVISYTFIAITLWGFDGLGNAYSKVASRFPTMPMTLYILYVAIIFAVYIVMFYKSLRAENKHLEISVLSLFFPLYAFAVFTGSKAFLPYMLIANLIYFVSAGLFAYAGVKKHDYISGNIGVAMLINQAAIRIFSYDIEILTRAIFFGICGVVVIVINRMISKRRRLCNEK